MQSFLGNFPRESLSGLAVACFDTRFRGSLWKRAAAPVWPGSFARWESSPGPAGELLREGHEEGGSPGSWGSRAERAASWAYMLNEKGTVHPLALK